LCFWISHNFNAFICNPTFGSIALTPLEAFWLVLGLVFARAFGKQFDQDVVKSTWFHNLNRFERGLIRRLLDFLHHWWMGLFIFFYSPIIELKFFGLGIFIDDLPDVPRRYRKFFKYLLIK